MIIEQSEENMSDLMKINQTGESKWFTNKEIAEVFGCDEGNIRKHKSVYKADFIYGIDWIYEKDLTNVGGVTGSNTVQMFSGNGGVNAVHTGQMFSGNDGDSPTLWSEAGIFKLAGKMDKTPEAVRFFRQYDRMQIKKEVLMEVMPMFQAMLEEKVLGDIKGIKWDLNTVEDNVHSLKLQQALTDGRIMRTFKNRVSMEEDTSWMYKDHYLTVPRFFEFKNIDMDRINMRVHAKNFIYWSRYFGKDIRAGRNDSKLSLMLAGKGNVFNAEIRFDILNIVWAHKETSLPRFLKVSEYLYNRKKRGKN